MADFDKEALEYHLSPTTWKRFRDDVFVLWPYGRESLVLFLEYINTLDPTEKIRFTMEVAEVGNCSEFLDLKLKWEDGKIAVDVHYILNLLIVLRTHYLLYAIPGKL